MIGRIALLREDRPKRPNVWLTDVGSHQVFKFSHDGALLLMLGAARVPGDDAAHLNLPTDVAVRPDGGWPRSRR